MRRMILLVISVFLALLIAVPVVSAKSPSPNPSTKPMTTNQSTSGSVALGTFPGNKYGNPAWDTSLKAVHDYEKITASKAKYVEVFHAFSDGSQFIGVPPAISTMTSNGYIPVITWEADDASNSTIYTPQSIAAGRYDSYIRSYARQVKALHGTVAIRLFHEMNGDWQPWSVGTNGASNTDIINAWRHVHDIFEAEGATNAKFVFSPNERHTEWTDSHPYADYYPGDAYVEYLALDGYNWGSAHNSPWHSFDQLFYRSYQELTALSPTKPVMIAEFASHTSPGDKAQWIRNEQSVVKSGKYPQIKALLWFNSNQDGASWRIDTSRSSINAYKALAADPYFQSSS
jgi:beta-mannanase